MDRIGRFWKRIPKGVRKTLVLIIGSTIVLTGMILLVLPGPGWAAIFLGFAILATEFAFAEKARDWLVDQIERLWSLIQRAAKRTWRKLSRRL